MKRGGKSAPPRNPRTAKNNPASTGAWTVALGLSLIAVAAVAFFASRGDLLAYGDAEAHLNIARKLWDNSQPSYREIGTVWLPVPHILILPFTFSDSLYRSGLAGAIPSAIAWVLSGVLLYSAVRKLSGSWEAAACATVIFASNPNLLYLATTPMTEPIYYMALFGLFHALVTESVAAAVFWTWCAALTRYDGWVLIPIATVYFATKGLSRAVTYAILAGLAPLYYLAHNWYLYGDPLEFYRGEWSAQAIYRRSHSHGFAAFPGEGNLSVAWLYYRTAAELALGKPLVWITAIGTAAAIWKRWYWFALLAVSGALFCLSGMRSGSGVEIFLPNLWPNSYYNSRYALTLLPMAALAGAALVASMPRLRGIAAILVAAIAIGPWIGYPRLDNWIVWKEGQINGAERRAWTRQMAARFGPLYQPGDHIFYAVGDLTGVLREARIPLSATLHSGNDLEWIRTLARPDLFLDQQWVLDFSDGPAAQAAGKRKDYRAVVRIPREHGAAPVVLLRRLQIDR